MSRRLQGWRCLQRSQPTLLTTRSNGQAEDGAEPSLVYNFLSEARFFARHGGEEAAERLNVLTIVRGGARADRQTSHRNLAESLHIQA